MKSWSVEHVRLAASAEHVRATLRRLDHAKLEPEMRRIIADCCKSLSAGLKCRSYRPRESGKAIE